LLLELVVLVVLETFLSSPALPLVPPVPVFLFKPVMSSMARNAPVTFF
jgi:hypothetical protein